LVRDVFRIAGIGVARRFVAVFAVLRKPSCSAPPPDLFLLPSLLLLSLPFVLFVVLVVLLLLLLLLAMFPSA
jgi:disulfide bond formation protein DsbB